MFINNWVVEMFTSVTHTVIINNYTVYTCSNWCSPKQNLNKILAISFVVLNVNYFPLSLTYVLFSCLNLIDSLYKCVYINSMLSR